MYTLRIIDQTKNGLETRKNLLLGKSYTVIAKTPNKNIESKDEEFFEKEVFNYFGNEVNEATIDKIAGFIQTPDNTFPYYTDQSVYIVGSEGQTIERVYGQYTKY